MAEKSNKETLNDRGAKLRFDCYHEKNAEECQKLGQYLEIFFDFEKAGNVFKHNCDINKYARSCFQLGEYLMNGKGRMEKNKEEGFRKYLLSCEYGFDAGCHNVGLISIYDKNAGLKDVDKGLEYLDSNCFDKDFIPSCKFLMDLNFQGLGEIKKDLKKAFKYSQKLCDMGSVLGCGNLSVFYRNGEGGIEKNQELSEKYLQKAKEFHKRIGEERSQ